MSRARRFLCILILSLGPASAAFGDAVTVAVASNFLPTADEIAARFAEHTGYRVRISSASTGKLYAQIVNGAPFDVFLAADAMRPRRLDAAGLGVSGTRFTYATGALVLWSRDPSVTDADCRALLDDLGTRHLAIANPDTAPYGAAAREFLRQAGLWERVRPNLVYGENAAQALHFVASGNAALGLIARSHAGDESLPAATCAWPVPTTTHHPLEQQAIRLRHAAGSDAARSFLEYLRGPESRDVIRRHGYMLPE